MKPIIESTQIQIDVTSRCANTCSNCHHLIGHFPVQWDMTIEQYKQAVDSVLDYPGQTIGMIGGDPVLSPYFEQYCEYLRSKVPKEKCGIWTCLPEGKEYLREVVVNTFGQIFINSHEKGNVLHSPILVASGEITSLQPWEIQYVLWNCWIARDWSSSINPHGAFRCETMGALSMLFGKPGDGWPVTPGWWKRMPWEYRKQASKWCRMCGAAMPLWRRESSEVVDDVSPIMLNRLCSAGSPKAKAQKFVVHDCKTLLRDNRPLDGYKDMEMREASAERWGIILMVNDMGYCTPYLRKQWKLPQKE